MSQKPSGEFHSICRTRVAETKCQWNDLKCQTQSTYPHAISFPEELKNILKICAFFV